MKETQSLIVRFDIAPMIPVTIDELRILLEFLPALIEFIRETEVDKE